MPIPLPAIRIGTCGFSYPEWIKAGIYPKGTKSADMLGLYSLRFPVVELNYTWYQMPMPDSVARMSRRVGPGFQFSVKLTRTMTHEIDSDWRKHTVRFRQGIAPLIEAGQLATVLIQLPPTFERTKDKRLHLAHLLNALEGLPLAVEFRHRSWAVDRVFAGLEQRRVSLVAVDTPPLAHLFPSLSVCTNPDLFYVRFHGRNEMGWRSGTMQQKFNYDYSINELLEWAGDKIPTMAAGCKRGLLFFNNHVAGQAFRNGETMIELLKQAERPEEVPVP